MAFYSKARYTSDGVTRIFSITFPFLSRTYVKVKINNVITTAFTFLSDTQIQLNNSAPAGVTVEVYRDTQKAQKLVDFTNGAVLDEASLDRNTDHMLHIGQEAYDFSMEAETNALSARGSAAASAASAADSADSAAEAAAQANLAHISELAAASSVLGKQPFAPWPSFGIVGDGVTDNAAALSNLYRWIEANGGGWIHFPKGRYATSEYGHINCDNVTITADAGACLVALNSGSARKGLLQINNNTNTADEVLHVISTTRYKNIRIHGLAFDMGGVTPVWPSEWATEYGWFRGALTVMACDNVAIVGVNVLNAVHAGISAVGCYNLVMDGCIVDGLKAVVSSVNQIRDGNCFNIQAQNYQYPLAYQGPWGHWKIINCTALGQREAMPPTFTFSTVNRANVGFHIETGGLVSGDAQGNPSLISGCTVEKCWYGIVVEGQSDAETGNCTVVGNTVKNCVFGIGLYPDSITGTPNRARNLACVGNHVLYSYNTGIFAYGEHLVVSDNVVTNYAMAKAADDWQGSWGRGTGIHVRLTCDTQTVGTFTDAVISGNVITQEDVHDTSYKVSFTGLAVATGRPELMFQNVKIQNNLVNGGYSTYTSGSQNSGILVLGKVSILSIQDNTVIGFPVCGILLTQPDGGPYTADHTPSNCKITGNMLVDNVCKTGGDTSPGVACAIFTTNDGFEFSGNTVIDTRATSHTYLALQIPQQSGADVASNHIVVRNNIAIGLKYGNTSMFELSVTGTDVLVSGNGHNSAAAAPTSTTYKRFAGEFVENNAKTLRGTGANIQSYVVQGWDCVASGRPGTWVERRTTAGVGMAADSWVATDGSGVPMSVTLSARLPVFTAANGTPTTGKPAVPATAASTGTLGQITWDATYIYVCTATDTWKRTPLSTW